MFVDHIAILTAELCHQSEKLPPYCRKEPMASFPAEGTMEQYVEMTEKAPRLLFLQPIAEGPYARALKKRGPGLHHIGAKTTSLKAIVPRLSEQGLFLHPISIETLAQGLVWLCKPGLPFLIELSEGEALAGQEFFEDFVLGLPSHTQIPDSAEPFFSNLRIIANASAGLTLNAGNRQIHIPLL